jgi:undecaprenyl diphosphate synthase
MAIEYCVEQSIANLTLFAFGRDNWLRPEKEVSDLMNLFYKTLHDKTPKMHKNNVVLKVVGDRTRLSSSLLGKIEECEEMTQNNTGTVLRLAVDYAGRWDITNAAKLVAQKVADGEMNVSDITEQLFESNLIGGSVPIDLLIRTSGEIRLSDFMLWQVAYAEMYFTNVMWPDFSKKELQVAVDYFNAPQRRFGKSGEQI